MRLSPNLRKRIGRITFWLAVVTALLAVLASEGCGGTSTAGTGSAPSITTQPQSQAVTAPAVATFTVAVTGAAPLSYQWNRNGNAIAGATGSSYTTPATSSSDNGEKFTVTVTNADGTVTSAAATLTVNSSGGSGALSLTVTAGNSQSALIDTAFAALLQVTVRDSSGNPVANETVTFTSPASGATGSFANGAQTMSATTDENGVANSSTLTANGTAGSYTVSASVSASTEMATYSLTNILPTSGAGIPQFSHVFIVVEENHSFSDVIGNASMPYLNGLASANSLATQYYADAHPSLPNYFELTVGAGTSITGTSGDAFSGVVTQDNVVRALGGAGKSWKAYAESLPSAGYLGGDTGAYLQHHNPVVYFSDVQQSAAQAGNVVPFSQLAADIASGGLPDYAFVVPNAEDDAHNCPAGMSTCTDTQKLAAADQWLSSNINPLLVSPAFQNSLLIIVFDESEDSDTTHGGGHVPAILVSPVVKQKYQSNTLYQHESVLRLMLEGLGVSDLPGAAANAPEMTEFFE